MAVAVTVAMYVPDGANTTFCSVAKQIVVVVPEGVVVAVLLAMESAVLPIKPRHKSVALGTLAPARQSLSEPYPVESLPRAEKPNLNALETDHAEVLA